METIKYDIYTTKQMEAGLEIILDNLYAFSISIKKYNKPVILKLHFKDEDDKYHTAELKAEKAVEVLEILTRKEMIKISNDKIYGVGEIVGDNNG